MYFHCYFFAALSLATQLQILKQIIQMGLLFLTVCAISFPHNDVYLRQGIQSET